MRLVVGLLALAGCIEPRYVTCGDQICPPDSTCLTSGLCASADSVAACNGVPDGSPCQTALFSGSCDQGACFPPRCGDGIVTGSEQCDGSVMGVDCVEYGFDLGIPACTDRCALDVVNTCVRFGWKRVLSVPAIELWTDDTRFGVIPPDRESFSVYRGAQVDTVMANSGEGFDGVTGNAEVVVAWSTNRILTFDGTSFAAFDVNLPAEINQLGIAADGTLYAGVYTATDCTVYERSPGGAGWSTLYHATTNSCTSLEVGDGQVLLAVDSGVPEVLRWNGTSWGAVVTAPSTITDVAIHNGEIYIATINEGLFRVANGLQSYGLGGGPQVVAVDSGTFGGGASGADVTRLVDTEPVVEPFSAPIGGTLAGVGQYVYMGGNGIYRFSNIEYSERGGVYGRTQAIGMFADGEIVSATEQSVHYLSPVEYQGYWVTVPYDSSLFIAAIAGASVDDFYVTDGTALQHYVTGNGGYVDVALPGTPVVNALWAPASGSYALYVVGDAQVGLARTTSDTWVTLTPPANASGCDLKAITGNGTEIVAVGGCNGEGSVWSLAGTTWTELYRGGAPLSAVAFDSGGNLYSTGPTGGVRRISGTWSDDPGARGISIGATGPDDVWAAGGPDDIVHWDGSAWSRVGVVGAVSPRLLLTPRAIYFVGTASSVLMR